LRLQHKFFLAFSAFVICLIASLLVTVEQRQRTAIVRQMEKRGVAIATHLAAVSTRSLLLYNFVALKQDAEKVSQDKDVRYAIILERQGRVAAYSGHDEHQGLILQDAVSQRAAQTMEPLVQELTDPQAGKFYDIAIPVLVSAHGTPEKWGVVRIGLSLHDMQEEIQQTRVQIVLLGVLGIACSVLVAALLARRILAPIGALVKGTMAVARGEFQHVTAVQTHDEIATLATNFNYMVSELLKHRTALEASNRQLDQKIHELSRMANYNENILTSMTSGLLTLDRGGCCATFSAQAEALTGLQSALVCGQPHQEVFADNAQFLQILQMSWQHQTPLAAPHVEFRRPEGQSVTFALRTAMLQDHTAGVVGLLVLFEDLTPLHTLEQQLKRADRLAALGQMAAGMAHEIKNPLASIRMFVQLLGRKRQDPSFLEKFDRLVPHELDRINFIVEELLELSRPAQLQCAPVRILTILQRLTEVYSERMQQQHVRLKTAYAAALPSVMADAEQLYRAFANVLLNALEAMPAGGELVIASRSVPTALTDGTAPGYEGVVTEPPYVALEALELCTTRVEVSIQDTGVGIPADKLDAMFTPFWTTKVKGTGLGLALTHKIVEEHRGTIHITSTVNYGTTVLITLPAIMPSVERPPTA
jgi:two-component system sensor histidine kinase AtoS